jgi:V/A-type H+/Na+-transporting ATPase subunit F
MNYRIAIIGSKETCMAFILLGIHAVPVETPEQAIEELFRLKKETAPDSAGVERNVYAMIFITEDLASTISPDDEKKLARGALPAIIPLPTHAGSTGYGPARLKRLVEQAVGSDILK